MSERLDRRTAITVFTEHGSRELVQLAAAAVERLLRAGSPGTDL
jgi:hypothetical protein